MIAPYPLSAIVGQDDLKLALLLNAVSPEVGGVLVRGEKGTAKSTAVRALAKLGFVVLDPGAHPFEAQAAMFWRAEAVVGAHGAGLANLAFAPNCRFAFELLSSGFRDGSVYAHICRHRGIAYGAASGEPVEKEVAGPRDPEGWPGHRSFRVDIEALLRELKGLL